MVFSFFSFICRMLFLYVDFIVSFLIVVGRWTFFRCFGVLLFVLMVRVFSFVFMLRSFSFIPGSSARIIRWSCSSKMSRSGCFSSVKLGM